MSTHLLPLRDYQQEALADLQGRWEAGATRVPMVLATGLGKTVIFAHLIAQWTAENPGKRALVLVHTDELVRQAYRKIKAVAPHLAVGIVKAEQNETNARVIVASVQSLRSARRRDQIRRVGLIVVDECFPAGTMIGGKPIESLKPGDLVPSWDEISGQEVMRPVVALMKSIPSGMVRVAMNDGTDFACTPNHPIMTTSGWCPAGGLWRGAYVVSFTHDANAGSKLYGVQQPGDFDAEGSDRRLPAERPNVLPNGVPGRVGEPGPFGTDGENEQGARIGTDEGTQPDAPTGSASKDDGHIEEDRAQAALAWREWVTSPGASSEARSTSRLAHRGHRRADGYENALALQDRYSASDDEGVRGSGRGIPLLAGPPSLRSAPGRTAVTTRVVSVQVLEPGGDGTYGGVCSDGFVYNIEVAGTHTYLVGERGTVVHNCHHATAATYRSILTHYGVLCADCIGAGRSTCRGFAPPPDGIKVVGFTATLARGDKAKLSDVWQECTFSRGISYGIRRGYLLDVRGRRIVVPNLDLSAVKKVGGDYQDAALGDALDASFAPSVIASAYLEHASTRKGIAFWPLVETAHHGADAFNELGIPSAVVHGGTPREERRLILKRLNAGEIQVVHNCGVLTEGFDDPTISCIVMARPTKSAPLYQQCVGRGLRPDLSLPADQRGDCLILDVCGAGTRNDLRTLIDLSERAPADLEMQEGESLLELEEALDAMYEASETEVDTSYVGPVDHVEFDPLSRKGIGAWLQTAGGTYFLPIGKEAYVLIVPAEEPALWDVAWLTQRAGVERIGLGQGDVTEHRNLQLDMACSWAEEVVEEIGGPEAWKLAGRKVRWRDNTISDAQRGMAAKLQIEITEEMTKRDLSDLITTRLASRRIDPIVNFMIQTRG